MSTADESLDPEEILNGSLGTLYDYQPITLSSSGSLFEYALPNKPAKLILRTPDTHPSNWSLHASSIWASSRYLVDHLDDLHLPQKHQTFRLLELGAGAGLPSIAIAKTRPGISVVASDYPDQQLIETISENIARNGVEENCRAKPYAWGSETDALLDDSQEELFDMIIAADTLWNPDFHSIFIDTLKRLLKRTAEARVHLVAGLHTGRYTLHSFIGAVTRAGFVLESVEERETNGELRRSWDVSRAEDEDEKERRRWVVWMVLTWSRSEIS